MAESWETTRAKLLPAFTGPAHSVAEIRKGAGERSTPLGTIGWHLEEMCKAELLHCLTPQAATRNRIYRLTAAGKVRLNELLAGKAVPA